MDGKYEPYTAENGIINQITCLDTLAQNEVLERNNCHILEVTHALMFSMGLPKLYLGDAMLTAAYLINKMPSSVLGYKPPIELLMGSTSAHIVPPKVFGCVCFVHDHGRSKGKLGPKGLKCVFIGY